MLFLFLSIPSHNHNITCLVKGSRYSLVMQTTTTASSAFESNAINSFSASAQGRKVEILWSRPSQTWDGRPKKKTLVRLMGVPFLVSEVLLPDTPECSRVQEALVFPVDENGEQLGWGRLPLGWILSRQLMT